MSDRLTSADLQAYLDAHSIPADILQLDGDTPTVEDAARVVGCLPQQILKSVLFMVQGEPYLCIAAGVEPVSQRKLATRLEVGRKRIKLAKPEEVLAHTGYAVGTVPPLGHSTPLTAFIDPRALEPDVVYGGGGEIHALMRIEPDDLQAHLQAEVLSLVGE